MAFDNENDQSSGPASRCFVITPHATNPLPLLTKAIRAPSDGVIRLRPFGSEADVDHPVLAGERIDMRISHVRVAGTTVTGTIIGYA